MIRFPLKYRSEDDYAPIDYSFVDSVAEGQRRREAQAIHQNKEDAVVRHQANPNQRSAVDAYGTRARRSDVVPPQRIPRLTLPTAENGPAPAQRVVYPEGMQPASDTRLAMNPSASPMPGTEDSPVQNAPEAAATPTPAEIPSGPAFDPPAAPQIPEWLRVAQQNNMPRDDRYLRRPTVVPAQPQEEEAPATDLLGRPMRRPPSPAPRNLYQEAGYPPELLEQIRQQEEALAAEAHINRRHGAQAAVRGQRTDNPRSAQSQAAPPADQAMSAAQAPPGAQASSYPPPRPVPASRASRYENGADPRQPALTQQEQTAWRGMEGAAYQEYAQGIPQGYASGPEAYGYSPQGYPPQEYAPHGYASPGYPQEYAPAYAPPGADRPRTGRGSRAGQSPERAEEEATPTETPARRIPWLGIATSLLACVAVGLWLLQMSFNSQTAAVFQAREAAQTALEDAHPYRYRELIETQAQINNLHPAFIAAIVLNESSFNPEAESSVGARGLMQMMPDTYAWVHGKISEGAVENFDAMYDATTNVRYACWYMNFLSERFRGDPVLVSAAFHAGQGTVQNWLNDSRYSADSQTIALEDMMDGPTKNYATRVLRAYAVYKRLYYEDLSN